MGDVFANAVLMDEVPEEPRQVFSLKEEEKMDYETREMFQKRPPRSSMELINDLPDSSKFFLLNSVDKGSASSSSSSSSSAPGMSCDACGLILKKTSVFIRCAECTDPITDLCVYCFSRGAELGSHKHFHGYIVINSRVNNFTKNRIVNKLDLSKILKFMLSVEQRGCFNYAELEKHLNISSGEVERLYLDVVRMLTRVAEMTEPTPDSSPVSSASIPSEFPQEGGPANFNILRDEFEHEYIPEAETLLAAVAPPSPGSAVPAELISLFDGYNGILDERERRRKVLKSASLINLRDYYNILKKRKTDEKDMFEKVKLFSRALVDGGVDSLNFLDSFSTALTVRKRLIDRVKRLLLLRRNGITNEVGQAAQFDADRKKRNDLNARKAIAPAGVKVWTALSWAPSASSQLPVAPHTTVTKGRSARSSPPSPTEVVSQANKVMTAPEAVVQLPGGWQLSKSKPAVELCVELQIAPQHLIVIQSAMHVMLKQRRSATDADLIALIREGVFGTIRRYLLSAQGLPVSVVPQQTTVSPEEMKAKVVAFCRSTFG